MFLANSVDVPRHLRTMSVHSLQGLLLGLWTGKLMGDIGVEVAHLE